MLSRFRKSAALAALVMALTVTACSSPSGDSDGGGGAYSQPSEQASTPSSDGDAAQLKVADSSLGQIVVDGDGMTLYMFDKDTQSSGESSCTGECLTNWPPFTTDSTATPELDGITGEIGTITTADGSTQITLNGWPLYYFAGDTAAGDVNGQGVGEIWWVLTPAGERMAG
ncbi:putative lipoprotein with Yx(FWY)xxD motif [Microbacterium natoriense]|uniref:Lipoprotein with Yx(FWY)xxD motif n=1 Tax=Microbacterium natoriense TaxID=284570 RepID=A0AAW8EW19_9MICO|nr:hypothetical protein [Microbacterium natoriense]MDQ0647655.1 putative lipoprotein with Yx(FWY)xxD motif [Microbacterium natoriense]